MGQRSSTPSLAEEIKCDESANGKQLRAAHDGTSGEIKLEYPTVRQVQLAASVISLRPVHTLLVTDADRDASAHRFRKAIRNAITNGQHCLRHLRYTVVLVRCEYIVKCCCVAWAWLCWCGRQCVGG